MIIHWPYGSSDEEIVRQVEDVEERIERREEREHIKAYERREEVG